MDPTRPPSRSNLGLFGLLGRFIRGGILPDRVNAVGVAAYVDHSTDDLVELVNDHLQPRGLTAGFGGRIALTDGLIHHQDIRRPPALPRTIPAERLIAALDFGRTAPTIGGAKRIRGLTLRATDLDWTTGTGPIVEGPAECLLMAIAGRPASRPSPPEPDPDAAVSQGPFTGEPASGVGPRTSTLLLFTRSPLIHDRSSHTA